MVELLRDPAWNGIAGIAAIIALIVAIWQEKRAIKILPRTLIVIGRALIGILVISLGPFIQWSIQELFAGGMPSVLKFWRDLAIHDLALNYFILGSFLYAIFPGTVTATISSSRNNKNTVLRTSIAAIISVTITDIAFTFIHSLGGFDNFIFPSFLYSLLFNLVGGVIVGAIIAYLVSLYDKAFEPV